MLLLNAINRKAGLNLESHTPALSPLCRSTPAWQQGLQEDKQTLVGASRERSPEQSSSQDSGSGLDLNKAECPGWQHPLSHGV